MPSQRIMFALGFSVCAALLLAALYFQHVVGLEPCPLCVFQRVCVIALGGVLLLGTLHNPRNWGRRVYAGAALLISLCGAAIAGRNLWLQHLPADRVPECGPGLEYMLDVFPLMQALEMVFRGSGECAEVKWTLLGLSMAGWMLIVFLVFAAVAAAALVNRRIFPPPVTP